MTGGCSFTEKGTIKYNYKIIMPKKHHVVKNPVVALAFS